MASAEIGPLKIEFVGIGPVKRVYAVIVQLLMVLLDLLKERWVRVVHLK